MQQKKKRQFTDIGTKFEKNKYKKGANNFI